MKDKLQNLSTGPSLSKFDSGRLKAFKKLLVKYEKGDVDDLRVKNLPEHIDTLFLNSIEARRKASQ